MHLHLWLLFLRNTIPVSLNSGFKMPAWFDIKGLDITSPEDIDGIKKATAYVHGLIEKEISDGIPSEKIVVGGFSQGGALALHSALTYPKKLAGVVALSCWLPMNRLFSPVSRILYFAFINHSMSINELSINSRWSQLTKIFILYNATVTAIRSCPMDLAN